MNILLSSVGRRGYLVQYFQGALGSSGQIWGVDSCSYAPGFVYCDHRLILPEVTCPEYCNKLLAVCKENEIQVIVPLIDPELQVLTYQRKKFTDAGIMVVVSPPETIEMAYDKYQTVQFAQQNDIAVPWTALEVDPTLSAISQGQIFWPIVVKPRKGSASQDIYYCDNEDQLRYAFSCCPDPMIQEVLKGTEYGYDLFADQNFRPISVYCKKKLAMRAGETDKAISTADPVLIEFGKKLLESMKLFGPADVDIFVDDDGPKLLEINPRFGGGYPCAHMSGANFCSKLIAMANGSPLAPDINSYPDGICMLKQDEIIQPDWIDS